MDIARPDDLAIAQAALDRAWALVEQREERQAKLIAAELSKIF